MPTFPQNPWNAVDAYEPADLARALPTMLAEWMEYRGAPRDSAVVRDFLEAHPPEGDILIHGAGTHTADLLPFLEALPTCRIVGVIDKLAESFDHFHGYPVVHPDQLDELEYDQVLLSNTLWEMQMRSALIERGVDPRAIRTIYADARYGEMAWDAHGDAVTDVPEAGCDFVVVDFARPNQQIVDDATLASILPPERTVRLASGRFASMGHAGVFRSYDFLQSSRLLVEMLARLQPRLVYLRTFTEDNLTFALIRNAMPWVETVHEVYDWGLTIEPRFMREVYGHDERSIQMALTGELDSMRHAGFVISKRGGPCWERVLNEREGDHVAFFPQLVHEGSRPTADGPNVRLVYAGNLPAPNTLDIDMVGTLFPLFEQLTEESIAEITVFNGAHRSTEDDERFEYYAASAGPRLHYHGARPYDEVVAAMADQDYGWMYFPRDGIDFIDEPVLISNKFTGYLSAGLPVVIDDGWEYMAELVERFDAGIVLSMRAPEELAARLEEADPAAHRRGARALFEHLVASNEASLETLRTFVSERAFETSTRKLTA